MKEPSFMRGIFIVKSDWVLTSELYQWGWDGMGGDDLIWTGEFYWGVN